MVNKRRNPRSKLLSHTRPTSIAKPACLPSHATRALIREHHTLQKRLHSALARNDHAAAASFEARIEAKGGLAKYQEASIQGQSLERGGDSSQVLMQWLSESLLTEEPNLKHKRYLRMLEVGALRTDNACSRSALFDMTRIDLHSQHPEIQTQDFMAMPTPSAAELQSKGYDIVSLSLVVNFVGDAIERGNMLKRVSSFLRAPSPTKSERTGELGLPALFLVLPASCVNNSRYLDEERLESIMRSLGYERVKRKLSAKLVYYLWRFRERPKEGPNGSRRSFRKEELRRGPSRNNFAVVIP